jgi:hypothetical protein
MEPETIVTDARLDRYFDLTRRALQALKLTKDADPAQADDLVDLAKRYVADAEHFRKQGDKVTAFAAVAYAHGLLDAGARLGLFDVKGHSDLFVVD